MTQTVVLLTGATGFIGGATTVELLQSHPDLKLILLVRAESETAARRRVFDSLARFVDRHRLETMLSRLQIVVGDITQAESLDHRKLERVTEVLHLAASTSLRSVRGVRETNIIGTQTLLRRMHRAPALRRFVHVGTAYICGKDPPPIVHEQNYPRRDADHVVEYTRTKAECEEFVERSGCEVPIVVARPSIVIGHTQLGCAPSTSIFWYYRLVDKMGVVTSSPEARRDIVPVDYVARSLVTLLFRPELRHRTYHISSGRQSSVTWREIQRTFAAADGRSVGNPYRQVSVDEFLRLHAQMQNAIPQVDAQRMQRAVEPFCRLTACGAEVFDNSRLLSEGLEPSPRFTDYLPRCLASVEHRSLIEQALDDE